MSTAIAEKKSRPTYDEEQRTQALTMLAKWSGNTSRAAQELEQEFGLKIDPKTLWRWAKHLHVNQYERIRSELLPQIEKGQADAFASLAARQVKIADQMAARLEVEIDAIPSEQLSRSSKDMITAAAISQDKAQLLNSRPTQIVQRDLSEALRELQGIGITIEGTAEDIQDAELVEDTAAK